MPKKKVWFVRSGMETFSTERIFDYEGPEFFDGLLARCLALFMDTGYGHQGVKKRVTCTDNAKGTFNCSLLSPYSATGRSEHVVKSTATCP